MTKRALTDDLDQELPPSKKQKLNENVNSKLPNIPIDGKNLLSILLHPLDKETFIREYWTKKCYYVSIDDEERVRDLLNGPFPFHLKSLLQQTASQKIHIWMKTKNESKTDNNDSSKLLSFTVDDYDSALSCYHCGGSLYFRASQELIDIFIPNIMQDLGLGIGANYNDNNLRGEIEVFVSHKQHLTNWHCDFQHNFSIQLFGHKRWYLLPINHNNSSYFNVYRGNTPHYNNENESDLDAKECQFKLHRSESEIFDFKKWKEFDLKQEYKDKIKIIDLKPGSTIYFPSGMWHKVETISDQSLSINLSIVPMTYSQLISNAINHFMSINPMFRAPILYNNNNNNNMQQTHNILNNLCDKLKGFISNINKYPSCIIPYSFSNHSLSANNTVCIEMVDFTENNDKDQDDDEDEDVVQPAKPPEITENSCFIINPLSIIIPFNDIYPEYNDGSEAMETQDLGQKFCSFDDLETKDDTENEEEEEEEEGDNDDHKVLTQFILHINFGETDSFGSTSRVILQCKHEMTVKIINWIRNLRKKKQSDTMKNICFSAKDIKDFIDNKLSDDMIYHILRVLTFFGWISVQS